MPRSHMPHEPTRRPVILALLALGLVIVGLSYWGLSWTLAGQPAPAAPTSVAPTSVAPTSAGSTSAAPTSAVPTSATSSAIPSATRPTAVGPFIVSAEWAIADGGRSFKVTPTTALRDASNNADAGWAELIARYPDAATPGMREQFVCHAKFASGKATWNLEPWRPAVSFNQTVLALCNPGPNVEPTGS